MRKLELLVKLAVEKCGGPSALAGKLGVHRQVVYEWETGKRTVTPETAALLCDVLDLPGEEAREWVAEALITNPKNAGKAEVLRRALFACWVLGVGSLATHSKDAAAQIGLLNHRPAVRATCTEGYTRVTHTMPIVAYWIGR